MASQQKRKGNIPSVSAKISRMIDSEDSKIKAIADVNIGGLIAIHGVKVMDSQKGLFVSMPQSRYTGSGGKTQYNDICHPVTAEMREAINTTVMAAYEEELGMQESESQESGFGLNM